MIDKNNISNPNNEQALQYLTKKKSILEKIIKSYKESIDFIAEVINFKSLIYLGLFIFQCLSCYEIVLNTDIL